MELKSIPREEFSEQYDSTVLEQWKTCVEMANSNTEKRTNSNNIFISINAALLAVVSFTLDYKSIVEASNPATTPLLGHRCRSSQEITGSPTPFSTSNHYLWICASASFSLSNPNIAA